MEEYRHFNKNMGLCSCICFIRSEKMNLKRVGMVLLLVTVAATGMAFAVTQNDFMTNLLAQRQVTNSVLVQWGIGTTRYVVSVRGEVMRFFSLTWTYEQEIYRVNARSRSQAEDEAIRRFRSSYTNNRPNTITARAYTESEWEHSFDNPRSSEYR